MKAEYRKVERWNAYKGMWQQVSLWKVEPGDRFRLFEPDGTPVMDANGDTEWIAKGRAELDSHAEPRIAIQDMFLRMKCIEGGRV